jgi:hypothetical protein
MLKNDQGSHFRPTISSLKTMASSLEWLDHHWMFLGPPVCLVIAMWKLCINKSVYVDSKDSELHMFSWLAMLVFSFHQLEEHGYDLYGRRYHFIEFYNAMEPWGTQMTPRLLTIINLGSLFFVFSLFAQLSESNRDYTKVGLVYAFMAFNGGVLHLIPYLTNGYNPGTGQSVLMTPLALYVLYKVYLRYGGGTLLASVLYGSIHGHVVTMLIPIKLVSLGYLNETGFAIWAIGLLVLYPILAYPLLNMWRRKSRRY